jgi:hypothetical protein
MKQPCRLSALRRIFKRMRRRKRKKKKKSWKEETVWSEGRYPGRNSWKRKRKKCSQRRKRRRRRN